VVAFIANLVVAGVFFIRLVLESLVLESVVVETIVVETIVLAGTSFAGIITGSKGTNFIMGFFVEWIISKFSMKT